jgi:cyclohexanone monooxygenase
MLMHEFLADWVADCIEHMDASGYATVQPTESAADAWGGVVARYAENLLRLQEDQYMVHVNEDGSRVFMPFTGGMGVYVPALREAVEHGYEGFVFRGARASQLSGPGWLISGTSQD